MIVSIKNMVKRYGDFLALDNVNMAIKEGEIFGLLGPNGAGKTTTINIMSGLTSRDAGEVEIFGKDILRHDMEIKRNIGVVPQDLSIYDDLTAVENVMFFGRLYGLSGIDLKKKAEKALKFTGLTDRQKELTKKFSGGMKRRLNIACSIVHEPKLIIMDEPTVGIDPQSRRHILDAVRELNSSGSTILYTSHYMEEVEALCSYICIMDKGRVIARGTNDELKTLVSSETNIAITVSSISYTMADNIKNLSEVRECTVKENTLNILSTSDGSGLSGIINIISESGSTILNINMEKPDLESVFLALTGRTLRD